MSIYGTDLAFGGFDDTDPAPLVYRGSHVLPEDDGERGGELQFASIGGFVGDGTREPLDLDCNSDELWPWLRVSTARDDVVLDLPQIRALHSYLGGALERMGVDLDEEALGSG